MEPNRIQANSDQQYRTLLGVWLVFAIGLALFFLLCFLVNPSGRGFSPTIGLGLLGLSVMFGFDSFIFKRRKLTRAIERHDPSQVNIAYLLSWLLCEAAGLQGVLIRFEIGASFYYLPFIVAALGMLFHFPRKEYVLAAY
jgi:hypothetical protein